MILGEAIKRESNEHQSCKRQNDTNNNLLFGITGVKFTGDYRFFKCMCEEIWNLCSSNSHTETSDIKWSLLQSFDYMVIEWKQKDIIKKKDKSPKEVH